MKKLLVVEGDQILRETLAQILCANGFDVTEAANGIAARDAFGVQTFDLVISDVKMPFLDGIELLNWIKLNRPTPVIFITGFTNILDAKQANVLGAVALLAKPFNMARLMETIEIALGETDGDVPATENPDLQFCRVSIDEFASQSKIEFDVFARLSAQKFIKIGAAGSYIPLERIHSYQEKGVQHLYIRKEDFSKLVDFNLDPRRAVGKSAALSLQKKINFMRYTTKVILERAFVEGVDQAAFDDAQEMLITTINVITEGEEHFALLEVLRSHSDWVYAHSVATSMFSLMIARFMKHSSSQTFFNLGMAGLFHKVGYKEIPQEILDKPRPLLSQTECTMIESHVTWGQEILSAVGGIPNDVIEIVHQQHEDNLGHGFPRRLKGDRIHPLAKILQAADTFADMAIKGPSHPGMPGAQALAQINNFHSDKIDPIVLRALNGIFKPGATPEI